VIEVKKLTKRFGLKAVLRGLDFQVAQGEFVALLGPNGAGKTTFLRSWPRSPPLSVKCASPVQPARSGFRRPPAFGVVSHLPLLYGDLTARKTCDFTGDCTG
jgi:ABC-type multidrug transport system ATPase subunit